MKVNLHIERLIIDGLPLASTQTKVMRAALKAELSRLMTDGGLAPALQSGGALPAVAAEPMAPAPRRTATQLGQQIARSVYSAIGKK